MCLEVGLRMDRVILKGILPVGAYGLPWGRICDLGVGRICDIFTDIPESTYH